MVEIALYIFTTVKDMKKHEIHISSMNDAYEYVKNILGHDRFTIEHTGAEYYNTETCKWGRNDHLRPYKERHIYIARTWTYDSI